jgi:hypothetical protein
MTRNSLLGLFALGLLTLPNVGDAGSINMKGALPLTCYNRSTAGGGTGHAGLLPNGDITGSFTMDDTLTLDESLVCDLFCEGDATTAVAQDGCGFIKRKQKTVKFKFKGAALQKTVPDPCRIPAVVVSSDLQVTCYVGWRPKRTSP